MWRSNHPYSKSKKQLQCLSPVEKGNTGKFCQNSRICSTPNSRPDRDLFVFILHGNIQPNALHNFRKVTNETHSTRNTPFDPSSLMMLGPNEFGIMDSNGTRTTIKPVKPGVEIR